MRLGALAAAAFAAGSLGGFMASWRAPGDPLLSFTWESIHSSLDDEPVQERDPRSPFNAEGFRDEQDFSAKLGSLRGRRVLAVLGSSGAAGRGLDFSETIGPTLERALTRRGLNVVVFNLARAGQSSAQQRRTFERWAPRLKADLVLTLMGHAEGESTYQGSDRELLFGGGGVRGALRRSRGGAMLCALGLWRPAEQARVSVEEYLDDLRGIAATASANGAKRTLVLPALVADGGPREARDAYDRATAAAFRPGGDPRAVVLPEKPFRGGRAFQEDGVHLNAEGVRMTVDALVPLILENTPR